MTKVLITGSSGFIGSYLVREMAAAGHRPIGVDLVPPSAAARFVQGEAEVPLVLGDLQVWTTIVGALEAHRPDVIVHNASFVRPDILAREPLTALRSTVATSLQVFEAARLFGVSRVVYISTIGVYPRAAYAPLDGNHPVIMASEGTPDTFYGAAKIAVEAFAFAYHHGFGTDVLIVRPSAVYGFGMNWPIYIRPMVEESLAGKPVRFATGGDMPRDYTHAADVAQMVRRCVEVAPDKVRDRIFHAATGREPVTAAQLAATVREAIPGADIEIGPGLAPDEVRDARTRARFDISAAADQLGYQPVYSDLRDGITEYAATLRAFAARAI